VVLSILQLTVDAKSSAWVFFRMEYTSTASSDVYSALMSSPVYSAVRSDGHKVNTDSSTYGISLINHRVYLNFFDYIPTAGRLYTYSLSLSRGTLAKPAFNASIYYVNVTERTPYTVILF
jgi:hypothetical protein